MIHSQPTRERDTVVLLHSLGTDQGLWQDQAAALREHFHVVAPNSRGHGGTPSGGVIDVDHWVKDLDALIEDHRPVHLVGLSMGGVQAMAYAARHPRKLRSLVLANTFAAIDPAAATKKIAAIRESIQRLGMHRYADQYLADTLTTEIDGDVYERLRSAIGNVAAEDYLLASEATFRVDLSNELARITVPTLVMIGDRDQKTPMPLSETLTRRIPDARMNIVPNAGHLSNIDASTAFTDVLIGFIETFAGVAS